MCEGGGDRDARDPGPRSGYSDRMTCDFLLRLREDQCRLSKLTIKRGQDAMKDPAHDPAHGGLLLQTRQGIREGLRRPERQAELEWLRGRVPKLFTGRTVLEIAAAVPVTGRSTSQGPRRRSRRATSTRRYSRSPVRNPSRAARPSSPGRCRLARGRAVRVACGFCRLLVVPREEESGIRQFVSNLSRKLEPAHSSASSTTSSRS